jgi:RNA polymerase sigma-70 factor (ECF subfamily)
MVSDKDFRALVREYGPKVLSIAMRVLGDGDKAQDVHQEVFLAVWRNWTSYNGRMNWDAYLYRATVQKAIDMTRRLKVRRLALEQPAEAAVCHGRPEDRLRTAELQQKLAEHLAKLPKRQAMAFVLARLEGLETASIAEYLGCSQRTVRVHLHRATGRLLRELGEYLKQ